MPSTEEQPITLGFRWLNQVIFPASAFVSTDKDEALNPQRYVSFIGYSKNDTPNKQNEL